MLSRLAPVHARTIARQKGNTFIVEREDCRGAPIRCGTGARALNNKPTVYTACFNLRDGLNLTFLRAFTSMGSPARGLRAFPSPTLRTVEGCRRRAGSAGHLIRGAAITVVTLKSIAAEFGTPRSAPAAPQCH
jgi:hypothetical protein